MKSASPQPASDGQEELESPVADLKNRISRFATNTAEHAREGLTDAYKTVRRRAKRGAKHSRSAIKHHPFESVLIATGVGLVVGVASALLFGRDRR